MNTPPQRVLASHPFLHGLPESHVARLTAHARSVQVPNRHRLFEEGGTADRFWLIQAGQVALDTMVPGRGRVVVEQLGRGDVVGLSWLFPRSGGGSARSRPSLCRRSSSTARPSGPNALTILNSAAR